MTNKKDRKMTVKEEFDHLMGLVGAMRRPFDPEFIKDLEGVTDPDERSAIAEKHFFKFTERFTAGRKALDGEDPGIWTKEPPANPGWYWIRSPDDPPLLVRFVADPKDLQWCFLFGTDMREWLTDGPAFRYSTPLDCPPLDPSKASD